MGLTLGDAEEKDGCKALFSTLSGGLSLVDDHGRRLSKEDFSHVDEILMSEVVRFQGMMSISISKAGGTLSSTPLFGLFKEACRRDDLQGRFGVDR